jgi:hypothetical protein
MMDSGMTPVAGACRVRSNSMNARAASRAIARTSDRALDGARPAVEGGTSAVSVAGEASRCLCAACKRAGRLPELWAFAASVLRREQLRTTQSYSRQRDLWGRKKRVHWWRQ